MTKNSVLNRPHVESHHGRSAKDLSREFNWNQSAGMAVPCFSQFFIKGTKGVINRRCFTRSASVVSPAFDRVTQHIDFFKIPLRYLYSPFNDWSLNINDLNSSLMLSHVISGNQNDIPVQLPSVDFTDILSKVLPRSIFAGSGLAQDTAMTKAWNEALRLIDRLEYGQQVIGSSGANVLNLLKLAGYQKVYFDHYRNTSYESNDAYCYNLDWMMDSPQADLTDSTTTARLSKMFTLRYVNYRNDFFHNVYPTLTYAMSTPNGSSWAIPSSVMGVTGNGQNLVQASIAQNISTIIRNVDSSNTAQNSYTNVQTLRSAFALDKLLRASAYAPKHVREQFKARFGIDPGNKVSFESERIGSYINDVVFGEVTATSGGQTSASTYSQVGDIAGKGLGSSGNDKDLEFYCEEDCLIMGIQYFMPKGFYDSDGMDEFNSYLYREDFWQPEFENLGLRPLYSKLLSNTGTAFNRNIIIGYTVPYQSNKLGIDRNFGLFNVQRLRFTLPMSVGTGSPVGGVVSGALNTFSTHVSQLRALALSPAPMSSSSFKVVPNDMDTIFKTSFSAVGDEVTDQFYGWMRIKCAIVNGMSVHGQPSL